MGDLVMRFLNVVLDWIGWLLLAGAVIAIIKVAYEQGTKEGSDKIFGQELLSKSVNIALNAGIAYVIIQIALPVVKTVMESLTGSYGGF